MSVFGDRLKEARKSANISQQELADAIGASKMCISAYERGIRYPREQSAVETYVSLARVLGISPSYLMGLDDVIMNTAQPNETFSRHEKEMIYAYRAADRNIRGAINVMLGVKQR